MKMSASDFWKDAELAREVSGRQAEMAREVEAWDGLAKEVSDLLEIAREADKVGEDGGLRLEIETERCGAASCRISSTACSWAELA